MRGFSPSNDRQYAMLPAVPPRFSVRPLTIRLTLMLSSRSATKCSEKRPGNSIMRSNAIDPETNMFILADPWAIFWGEPTAIARRRLSPLY